jgi:hypothetical protein
MSWNRPDIAKNYILLVGNSEEVFSLKVLKIFLNLSLLEANIRRKNV